MKIIMLNIPRLQFRRDFVAGLLFSRFVPIEQMIVWKGRDADDYEKTYQVFEDAIKDGFRHFQRYLDMNTDDWLSMGAACQHWDLCRIFRYIQTINESCIYLHDDRYLPKHYNAYLKLFDYAASVAIGDQTELKYIALDYSINPDRQFISHYDIVEPEKHLMRGIPSVGTDVGAIITPAGASWLLDIYAENDIHPLLECSFESMIEKGIDLSGVYTVANEGSWLYGVPYEIAPSNLHTDQTCQTPRIPVERTRRTND